jgi:hypothetical protein
VLVAVNVALGPHVFRDSHLQNIQLLRRLGTQAHEAREVSRIGLGVAVPMALPKSSSFLLFARAVFT